MSLRFKLAPAVAMICAAMAVAQSDNAARQKLIERLDAIADPQLAERAKAIANIRTRSDAERRKPLVRGKILKLIGGLPERRGPVAVKQFGSVAGVAADSGFRIEKLAYESLPGFWVTANLYVPASGSGPFPAVLLTPGHEASGKQSQYSFGANFARAGIMALAIDPLGQGERLQYFDAERKASIIGGSTGEHGEANIPALLIGEDVARYFINDGMRGIDYLIGRPDVDASRIGALGCSGGGTATAYLAALDSRIKAVGVACYLTSFHELLPSATGVQEAEQSIPRFLEQGLDFADWVELAAPAPYAIISTTNDMFPFEGARQTYEETRRIYTLYGAVDNLQWITGPGGHGNLGPISPAILGFFLHHLKGAPAGDAPFTALRPEHAEDLLVTPTGQVATSIGRETVASIVRAHSAKPTGAQSTLRGDIRALTAAQAKPGASPPMVRRLTTESGLYRLDSIAIQSDGLELPGKIAIPQSPGRKPAILMVAPLADIQTEFDRLAQAGRIVMQFEPTPAPPGTEGLKSPYLGPFNLLSLRAFLVGKTIVGLRIDDVIRAVDWLAARGDVDPGKISAYGAGAYGTVVLHAAALDARIQRIVLENTLASYRMAIEQPLHRNISEVMIPGVLLHYDIDDLVRAISPRQVVMVNPVDATGAALNGHARQKGDRLPLD